MLFCVVVALKLSPSRLNPTEHRCVWGPAIMQRKRGLCGWASGLQVVCLSEASNVPHLRLCTKFRYFADRPDPT
ncbi:hypothetical protein DFJ73DRAFT_851857 [Zopfochytrium polystomum]|nr:hypothetical protein DFJ73DRAFT_851857 [Zopfochytrium polystomum]